MLEIRLEEMRYYAYHGVLEQEQRVGNHYVVSLALRTRALSSCSTDELSHTLSYADVYTLVSEQMAIPSRLLEHVAGRIARAVVAHSSDIEHITVSISKCKPPIAGDIARATITLDLSREQVLALL